ncbi:MAG: tRNA lysidine(34) synthetase TilS [Erysipelotrichaceae bacterium]|jgi:tRNA(Ile)-lysidine synthase|nr:tRNA lysidine(34) synthetase TilS [Erysipelotrichaceae bacterium]
MLSLDKSRKYLLACSFGPDSMALFSMLVDEGYNFIVGHVNYGVRKEADDETKALNHYCAQNDIEIEILYAKPIKQNSNFESKAREIRYKFFKEIYDENNIDALLVAHQEDDVLETYFLQRKRGGFVEQYGIKEKTKIFDMEVIRPLLHYSKSYLEQYCVEHKVPFAIDSSNLSDDFARNVIRHTIVSKMNKTERREELLKISNLNKGIEKVYAKLLLVDLMSKNKVLLLNDEEFHRALVIMVRKISSSASISESLSREIKKILLSKKPNVTLKIKKDLFFVKEYDFISFKKEDDNQSFEYVLDEPKVMDNKYFFLNFKEKSTNRNVKIDDYPITIRNAKLDDSIMINNYRVEVRRLFIDWKMPASLRKRWPIIINKNGTAIYIPRYRRDFKKEDDLNFYVKK